MIGKYDLSERVRGVVGLGKASLVPAGLYNTVLRVRCSALGYVAGLSLAGQNEGMKKTFAFSALLFSLLLGSCGGEDAPTAPPPVVTLPPFGGTILIDPNIITSSDPTTFENFARRRTGSGMWSGPRT